MRNPRTAAGMVVGLSTAAALVALPTAPSHAAAPPAAYDVMASGSIVKVNATLASQSLTNATIGYATASTDSKRASGDARAASSNIQAKIANTSVPVKTTSAKASPSATSSGQVPAVTVPALLNLGVVTSKATAHYRGDNSCPAASGSTRLLSQGVTKLASADLVTVPAVGTVASIGVSSTTTTTKVVGTKVVGTTSTTVGDISLLGGQVKVHVASPATMTATSTGAAHSISYNHPSVVVTVAGQSPVDLNDAKGGSMPITVPGLATITLTLPKPSNTSAGARAAATLPAVLTANVNVDPANTSAATVHLAVAPMSANAQAPLGGLECSGAKDSDGDGLTNATERALGTNPYKADTDGDGIKDGAEDPDHDGLTNAQEIRLGTNPHKADTDGDGLKDGFEVHESHTNPLKKDTDGDGIDDGAEDPDHDGLTNAQEQRAGTNPRKADTDGDGLSDKAELTGIKITYTVRTEAHGTKKVTKIVKTNPTKADTDGDGLTDKQEITGVKDTRWHHHVTDPTIKDTDHDGLSDGVEEKRYHSNPDDWDTDHGGISDGVEVRQGTNPNVS